VDPTAAPWRALEDPADVPRDAGPPAAGHALSRSTVLIGLGALVLAGAAFLLAFASNAGGTVILDGGEPLTAAANPSAEPAGVGAGPSSRAPELVVEIVGAIDRPGVFRLPAGSRVGDLVDAAGGYGARVDAERASRELNLAALLRDGDQVRVPSRDDKVASGPQPGGGSAASTAAPGPLDLNRATAAELEALPGIGPVTATKILGSRDEQPFAAVEDLRARKLLGEKTFAKLKDLLMVR
jgi:competence protein ComEA